jgi:RNA polymerase sigma-70 factor (ECF subfamily)
MGDTATTARSAAGKDARLARKFLSGDRTAFDRLVTRHQDRVYNLCLWMLGDPYEADEAAQDTFVKVYRALHSFRFESAFSTWLYRIAVNTCKNRRNSLYFRFKQAARRIGVNEAPDRRGTVLDIPDPGPRQDDALQGKQTAAAIRQAISSLPAERRTAIVLRDVEGMSYEEIAAVTGAAVGTVKSRLARGRQQLQQKLKGLR